LEIKNNFRWHKKAWKLISKQNTDDFHNCHSCTLNLDIIKVFYSPTDAQVKCLKIYIKIYFKTALTCFGAVTPSSGSTLFMLAMVTVVKMVNKDTSVCG